MSDGVNFTVEGVQELYQNLDILDRRANDGMNSSLREGAEAGKTIYENATPRKSGQAQGDVSISNVSTDGASSYKSIKLGYGASSYWYMWFVHEGTYDKGVTKGIVPKKHIEKALPELFSTSQGVITNSMRDSLGGSY